MTVKRRILTVLHLVMKGMKIEVSIEQTAETHCLRK